MEDRIKMQLNILIQLAETDKHFAQTERDLILKVASDNDISDEEVRLLIKNPEPIDALKDMSNDQKFSYLITCIRLIFADQKIFEKELLFAKTIATKLGFKQDAVEYLIAGFDSKPYDELKSKVLSEYS